MKINIVDIRKLDLNLSVVFLAVWQERSVTKAASRLALSQAATSAALARLRETCGDALFVRTRGGMEPTPRASAMAEQLESGVAHLWQVLTQHQTFNPATTVRSFSIGMSDDFELAIGPGLSRLVREEGEHVSLIFRQTNRHTVEQMLNDREIDLAVVSGTVRRAWITQEHIGDAGYACLVDAKALDCPLPLTVDDYLRLPHLLVSYSGRSGIVDTALNALGKQRVVHTALTHFSAVPAFLAGVRAVVTLPSHAAAALARMAALTVCPVPMDLGEYPVQLLWRRDSDGDPALEWLKERIRVACAGALDAAGGEVGRLPSAEIRPTSAG
ncbi:LysR substrate-binding domain-containing protein [Paraburkholderia megapolitana]|uniref:DNA-binding transcriptional regulator, LysR family n=1 Tax=Paraburkholderia megapolitana TaxID=420953 RepID=A0A1I3STB6_9BURK|nr:LysR substrate-binding domain-containing protein [Paraburkholderia megapolitana]QDQ85602.1 LysR family transcriptional regulator [Paraburkholderia megapolitana]SFJ60821.1 DNA-binding transcriptional regulator, LysR family [Paraburkholderia megapolitana]